MPDQFQYDAFLNHGAKDKVVVRPLAERLRGAVRQHLKVWFDGGDPPGGVSAERRRLNGRAGKGRGWRRSAETPLRREEYHRRLDLCIISG